MKCGSFSIIQSENAVVSRIAFFEKKQAKKKVQVQSSQFPYPTAKKKTATITLLVLLLSVNTILLVR